MTDRANLSTDHRECQVVQFVPSTSTSRQLRTSNVHTYHAAAVSSCFLDTDLGEADLGGRLDRLDSLDTVCLRGVECARELFFLTRDG